MIKLYCALSLSIFTSFSAFAQDTRIYLKPEMNFPLGNLKWAYQTAPGIEAGFSRVNNDYTVQQSFGVSLSYTRFQPQADTLYFNVYDTDDIGKVSFGSLTAFHLKAHINYAFPLGKKVAITCDIAVGILYGKRNIYSEQPGITEESAELAAWVSVTPTAGVEYIVTEKLSFVVSIGYSAMLHGDDTAYGSNAGVFYHFWTPGLATHFNF